MASFNERMQNQYGQGKKQSWIPHRPYGQGIREDEMSFDKRLIKIYGGQTKTARFSGQTEDLALDEEIQVACKELGIMPEVLFEIFGYDETNERLLTFLESLARAIELYGGSAEVEDRILNAIGEDPEIVRENGQINAQKLLKAFKLK